jgi:hypothetical protein
MLVACRLAGLSAVEAHNAGINTRAQCTRREGWLVAAFPAVMPQRDSPTF